MTAGDIARRLKLPQNTFSFHVGILARARLVSFRKDGRSGNSARSIIAEAILNRLGLGKFKGYSAGSHPKGAVNLLALAVLRKSNFDISQLRSKSWDEFAGPDAPQLDFVFTVCDDAAKEARPIWPGQPMTAHWGLADPAKHKERKPRRRSPSPIVSACSISASASS
jgi:arsenate reductase